MSGFPSEPILLSKFQILHKYPIVFTSESSKVQSVQEGQEIDLVFGNCLKKEYLYVQLIDGKRPGYLEIRGTFILSITSFLKHVC